MFFRVDVWGKFVTIAVLYGGLFINWYDIENMLRGNMPTYHLALGIMYFLPFIVIPVLLGKKGIVSMLWLTALVSVLNDVFFTRCIGGCGGLVDITGSGI